MEKKFNHRIIGL